MTCGEAAGKQITGGVATIPFGRQGGYDPDKVLVVTGCMSRDGLAPWKMSEKSVTREHGF